MSVVVGAVGDLDGDEGAAGSIRDSVWGTVPTPDEKHIGAACIRRGKPKVTRNGVLGGLTAAGEYTASAKQQAIAPRGSVSDSPCNEVDGSIVAEGDEAVEGRVSAARDGVGRRVVTRAQQALASKGTTKEVAGMLTVGGGAKSNAERCTFRECRWQPAREGPRFRLLGRWFARQWEGCWRGTAAASGPVGSGGWCWCRVASAGGAG